MKSSQFIPLGFTCEIVLRILRVKKCFLARSSQFTPSRFTWSSHLVKRRICLPEYFLRPCSWYIIKKLCLLGGSGVLQLTSPIIQDESQKKNNNNKVVSFESCVPFHRDKFTNSGWGRYTAPGLWGRTEYFWKTDHFYIMDYLWSIEKFCLTTFCT